MDLHARRNVLATIDNPETKLDYIVSLNGSVESLGRLSVSYVPDRRVLTPDSFRSYLALIAAAGWSHPEAAAIAILHDLNNELVARWVQVSLVRGEGIACHRVTVEDRQPKWDNPGLLSRL
jgi:7-cyano-7-deazaguanine reductase